MLIKVVGLDIAYYKNGWVYHTEFDKVDIINEGAIQHGGENLVAIADALLASPNLNNSTMSGDTKFVFYDIVGLFTISYRAVVGESFSFYTDIIYLGLILNYIICSLVVILVGFHLFRRKYHITTLFCAFFHHLTALFAMLLAGFAIVGLVYVFNVTMCWYASPLIVLILYIFPILSTGFCVHSMFVCRQRGDGVKSRSKYKVGMLILTAKLVGYLAYGYGGCSL